MPGTPGSVAPQEYDKVIAELAEWCKPHGRQAEAAKALGVDRRTVNSWLKRTRKPGIEMFFKIKAFLRSHRK